MGSPGDIRTLTRADFLNDVLAGYDYLVGLAGVDARRVSVAGESFGAYMACVLSTQRAVNALALRVPTDFPDTGFASRPQEQCAGVRSLDWKTQAHHFDESRALHGIHQFHGPLLLVAAEHDAFVPYQTIQNYRAAVADPTMVTYTMLHGTGHALLNPLLFYRFMTLQSRWLGVHL